MADRLPIVSIAGEKKELPSADTIAQSKINGLASALALKAPLASPVFTGISDFSAGGAYFGTAAAANLLDDYEEGTWTPAVTSAGVAPTITYTSQYGYYTKIGNVCNFQLHLNFEITVAGTGLLRASVPVLTANLSGNWQHIRSGYSAGTINVEAFAIQHNASLGVLYSGLNTSDDASVTGTRIFVINASYLTA
jgi:hypothetical protein